MEIEKKYLINKLPQGIDDYPRVEIEQAYINTHKPTLRIRRWNNDYIFTYKNRVKGNPADVCVADEVECTIDKETYERLLTKAEGIVISKTRYLIPYGKYTIELDVFSGEYEGLELAEVEFASTEDAKEFIPPEWFGQDVSGDIRYTNSYMSRPGGFA